jgi:hypothetical protein
MSNDIYSEYSDFLSGKKLDVGRRFYNPRIHPFVDRVEYLRLRCTDKKVLHVGCLDHFEIIPERVKADTWLHNIITNISELCIGIDIDSIGCDFVSKKFSIENIKLLDLSKPFIDKDIEYFREIQWDIILCPETLEHITNHQLFLQNLRRLSHHNTTLIITVPNAFQFENFINALRGFELINSDHKYWFTFYTLSRLLVATGWKPRQLIYYQGSEPWSWMRIRRDWMRILCMFATRLSHVFCNGLIIEATQLDCSEIATSGCNSHIDNSNSRNKLF